MLAGQPPAHETGIPRTLPEIHCSKSSLHASRAPERPLAGADYCAKPLAPLIIQ